MQTIRNLMKALVMAGILLPLNTMAEMIFMVSALNGSKTPVEQPEGSTLINGDFILQNWGNNTGPVGDGLNDETTWLHDFSTNINYAAFIKQLQSGMKIGEVNLTLQLITGPSLFHTDFVQVDGLGPIGGCGTCNRADGGYESDHFDIFDPGSKRILNFTLLDYYSRDDFTEYFLNNFGRIVVQSADDAIIYSSALSMVTVPEPATILLMGSGLLGFFGSLKKRHA